MEKIQICDNIWYVGVNDRTTVLFENLWPLPYGVSYNSYMVKGDKTAIIDGGKEGFGDEYIDHVRSIADRVDYIVVNHVEPDHSGLIRRVLEEYPGVSIVTNKTAASMLKGFYGIDDSRFHLVGSGDTLNLGDGITLKFTLTPMVHWPETMMTYVVERKVLFSGDAFGCFGALDAEILDTNIPDISLYINEMYRYYSNIVGKYGAAVTKALKALDGTPIDYICSTHGPVWHRDIPTVHEIYSRLGRYESQDGVCIVYGSMYGNTKSLAEEMARKLAEAGIRDVKLHEASFDNLSFMISDAFRYRGLIIGSPTYSMSVFPPVQAFVSAMALREIKGKTLGLFGSYAWAPGAMKTLVKAAEDSSWPVAASMTMQLGFDDKATASLDKFVEDFLKAYNA